ncbi:MAG: hypothetical protein ACQXXF_04860 [Thermoplasmatota archaeon]
MNIAVDSTGFRTHNSSTWYDIRIKRDMVVEKIASNYTSVLILTLV